MMLERCPFCFAGNGCSLKFTKLGKPYLSCRICMTRAFLNSMDALRGVAIAPALIDAVLRQLDAGDPSAQWVRERTAQLRKYVRDTMTGKGLPDTAATPVPYTDDAEGQEKIA